jgi:hypothetical protein
MVVQDGMASLLVINIQLRTNEKGANMIVDGNKITIIRGDTESITVSCVDTLGVPVPLVSGDKVYFTIKKSINTTTKALQKLVTTFTDGKAIIAIAHSDTKDLPFGEYYYDVQLTRVGGNVTTIIPPSKFIIGGEITYD